jgi:hypothetical protein
LISSFFIIIHSGLLHDLLIIFAVTFCFSSVANFHFFGIKTSFQDFTFTKPKSQVSVKTHSTISNLSFNIFTIIPSYFQFFLSIFAFTKSQYLASPTFLE